MYRIRRFFESLTNLIYYFRVIWNDRDWDHIYIHYILLRKLEKTLKRYSSHEYVVDQEKEMTKPLRICVEILKREENCFYLDTDNGLICPDEGITSYCDVREDETTRLLYRIIGEYVRYWWD